uniref:Secreted protein n=1 Tax=Micrurus spixii TaxID=129469 RepID=A0A2D4N1D5_9SAUR
MIKAGFCLWLILLKNDLISNALSPVQLSVLDEILFAIFYTKCLLKIFQILQDINLVSCHCLLSAHGAKTYKLTRADKVTFYPKYSFLKFIITEFQPSLLISTAKSKGTKQKLKNGQSV